MEIRNHSRYRFRAVQTLAVGVCIAALGLVAWAGGPRGAGDKKFNRNDTIPAKEKGTGPVRDFDKELRQLDEATKHLQGFKYKEWGEIDKELEAAMKKVDFEKIRIQSEDVLSKIDMQKIAKDIERSLSKIDFDKIEQEIGESVDGISNIDKEKIKEDLQNARKEVEKQLKKNDWQKEIEEIKKIDMKEVEKELENAKKEIAKAKEELGSGKLDLGEIMSKAKLGIEKGREELQGFQEMIYAMEKDGLLNTTGDYTVEYKKDELWVNGKKQLTATAEKYKKYFKSDDIIIKKEKGNLKIDRENVNLNIDRD